MEWVSVLERLPPHSGCYHLKGKGGYPLVAWFWAEGKKWELGGDVPANKVDEEYLMWLDENETKQ